MYLDAKILSKFYADYSSNCYLKPFNTFYSKP
jgi:hypothetical protein